MISFKRPFYLLIIAVLPLLFFLPQKKIHEPLHQVSLTIMKPFLIVGDSFASMIRGTNDQMHHLWNTFKNQSHLETEIKNMKGQLFSLEEAVRENERLKELLAFKENFPRKTLAVSVIGWDISPWRKTLILGKGELDGLKKNMTVVAPNGLVGRILEIAPSTARVLLLLDPDSRVSGMGAESRAHGIIAGNGSNLLTMKYLDIDAEVSVGEPVMSSGMGGIFAKGIEMGRIESISKDNDGLHLVAKIKPFVEFSKIEEVLCLDYSRGE